VSVSDILEVPGTAIPDSLIGGSSRDSTLYPISYHTHAHTKTWPRFKPHTGLDTQPYRHTRLSIDRGGGKCWNTQDLRYISLIQPLFNE
jgi:hypothetical protein